MTPTTPVDPGPLQRTVEAFVLRARRVEAHSLADPDNLQALRAHATIEQNEHGQYFMRRPTAPEELLESLAARVRPVVLKSDPVFHGRVLNALRVLAPNERSLQVIDATASMWKGVTDKKYRQGGIQLPVLDNSKDDLFATDTALAWGWVYGDLVHADTVRREATGPFGIHERHLSAVAIVAEIALFTLSTLWLIQDLIRRDEIQLPPGSTAFTDDVVATRTEWLRPVKRVPRGALPPPEVTATGTEASVWEGWWLMPEGWEETQDLVTPSKTPVDDIGTGG